MKQLTMQIGPRRFDFHSRCAVMGIVNVTPDSFSDGGRYDSTDAAVEHGLALLADGADILDIGGESTRPGSDRVDEATELARVTPVIERLAGESDAVISVDTTKATVARAALKAGAHLVNDISGMTFDPAMREVVAASGAAAVLMHTFGDPKVMQQQFRYADVVEDVYAWLARRIDEAVAAGVSEDRLIVDPGIGFGKSVTHNLELIRGIARFAELGRPVLMGPSRKAFIGKILDLPVEDRLEGTLAAVAACCLNGAHVVRVHDVKPTVRVCRMCDAIANGTHVAD